MVVDSFSTRTQLQPGVRAFADHSKHLRYRQNPEEHRRYFEFISFRITSSITGFPVVVFWLGVQP